MKTIILAVMVSLVACGSPDDQPTVEAAANSLVNPASLKLADWAVVSGPLLACRTREAAPVVLLSNPYQIWCDWACTKWSDAPLLPPYAHGATIYFRYTGTQWYIERAVAGAPCGSLP